MSSVMGRDQPLAALGVPKSQRKPITIPVANPPCPKCGRPLPPTPGVYCACGYRRGLDDSGKIGA